jgi:hypothetical protein
MRSKAGAHWRSKSWALALLAPLCFPMFVARADENSYGKLDLSKLDRSQMTFLLHRIDALSFESAILSHCGRPYDFERRATQAIRACVTADALGTVDSIYQTSMRKNAGWVDAFKPSWPCRGPFVIGGHSYDDEAVVVDDMKKDLDATVDQIAQMCRTCKTSIWAAFCQ